MLASRCAGPPLDDLLGSKEEATDGARGVLSSNMIADIVDDEGRVQEEVHVGLWLVVVCQAIAKEQGTLCVDVLPGPVLEVVSWPVKPDCGGEVAVKGGQLLSYRGFGQLMFPLLGVETILMPKAAGWHLTSRQADWEGPEHLHLSWVAAML